jgi:hypothetical protein
MWIVLSIYVACDEDTSLWHQWCDSRNYNRGTSSVLSASLSPSTTDSITSSTDSQEDTTMMNSEEIPSSTTMPPTPSTEGNKREERTTDTMVATDTPSRFHLWYALTVFSAVSLIALSTETESKEWRVEEKWVLSVTLMSMVLGSLASLAHIRFQEGLVGMPIEGIVVGVYY